MCGRFVAVTDPDGLARFFMVDDRRDVALPPSWNVAPTEEVHAVVEHERRRALVVFRWGLVPAWGSPARASTLINARAETAAGKPAFRDALRRRRCLIPADGFYEWQTVGSRRVPHLVAARDRSPLALAGLWSVWRDPVDSAAPPLRTCTILTTKANKALASLHDRMPVVLSPDAWDLWLDRREHDAARVSALLEPAPAELLDVRAVATSVNDVRYKASPLGG